MKEKRFLGSMLIIALASIFVLTSCVNKTKQDQTREEVKEEVVEIKQELDEERRDFNNYSYSQKKRFLQDANEELDDINEEIDEMKEELKKAGNNISAETRAAYEKGIADLETMRDDYKKNIDKVENSTEDNWEKTKKDVANTYDKAKENIKDAWEDVKRGVTEGVNKAKERLD